jgi:glycosyltransferase involved in cell wall biosynthesis
MHQPTLSVVTICLNAGRGLLTTAQSVLSQKYLDTQYIIKDGGSSDGSLDELPRTPRMKIVARPDSGIYDAMNQAVSLCSGEYILFLNAGDRLADSDVLAAVAACASQYGQPELVYTHVRNESRNYVDRYPPRLLDFFLYRRVICHQASYVRRDCFQRLGPLETTFLLAADHDFLTRLLVKSGGRSVLCPVVGVHYKGGGVSETANNRRVLRKEIARVRGRNFTLAQRVGYGCLWQLTLPWFRSILSQGRFGPTLQHSYYRLTGRR